MKKKNIITGKFVFVATISLVLLGSSMRLQAAKASMPFCEELRKTLNTRVGLVPYALEAIVDDRGKERIPNVDIDGDDVSDEVLWSCPKAGSSVPADPCSMSIRLSSSKDTITFEKLRFFPFRYHSKIYIVASTDISGEPTSKSDIYRVDRSGVSLVCSKL